MFDLKFVHGISQLHMLVSDVTGLPHTGCSRSVKCVVTVTRLDSTFSFISPFWLAKIVYKTSYKGITHMIHSRIL